jgi:hypothetical protein
LAALRDVYDVEKRHLNNARRNWWKYRISKEFNISPREVDQWDAEDVLEALAAIAYMNKKAVTN